MDSCSTSVNVFPSTMECCYCDIILILMFQSIMAFQLIPEKIKDVI